MDTLKDEATNLSRSTFKTTFRFEQHCDECCDIIHTHFYCPICDYEDADTDVYSDLEVKPGVLFGCEGCKFEFEIVNRIAFNEADIKIVQATE